MWDDGNRKIENAVRFSNNNNDIEIKYNEIKLDIDIVMFPNIDGRYKISIKYESDNLPYLIDCVIDGMDCSKIKDYHESGERLECL